MRGLIAVGALLLTGCSFSGSSPEPSDDSDAAPNPICPDLNVNLAVNGVDLGELSDGATFPYSIRITDLIDIDTTGTCGEGGATLDWTIPPTFLGEKADGAVRIKVFPSQIGAEEISLTISDAADSLTVTFPVDAVGFQELPYVFDVASNGDQVRGLAHANGLVFASMQNGGILQVPIDDPHAPAAGNMAYDIALDAGEVSDPEGMHTTGNVVWIVNNPQGADPLVRYDAMSGQLDNYPSDVIRDNIQIRDISDHPMGVRVSGSDDVFVFNDTMRQWVLTPEVQGGAWAVASFEGDFWYGDDRLSRHSDSLMLDYVGNGSIRRILVTEEQVWVAGDGIGLANFDDMLINQLSVAGQVLDLAEDGSGDIWAVSNNNGAVLRYHQELGVWHTLMANSQTGVIADDARAVLVVPRDEGPDDVYVGTNDGLMLLSTRVTPP